MEWCLCKAQGETVSSRSVQQLSECTDGLALDKGSQVERTNTYCVGGFPDVHMDFIVRSLTHNLQVWAVICFLPGN